MNSFFHKLTIFGTTGLAVIAIASVASAAPSLGLAKGRPYYGSTHHSSGSYAVRSYAPATVNETRQSFSQEPAADAAAPQAAIHNDAKPSVAKPQAAAAPETTRQSFSYEPATQSAPSVRRVRHNAGHPHDAWLRQKAEAHRYSSN